MFRSTLRVIGLSGLFAFAFSASLGAQAPPLPIGATEWGSTSQDGNAVYEIEVESAGVLTIVARATNDADILLIVTDADGQTVPDGQTDLDLGGNPGAEQAAITLQRGGRYQVRVRPFMSEVVDFTIGASWLPFADLEVPADPDGSPRTASKMTVGEPVEDQLELQNGDPWDWFSVRIEQSGLLTVATRAEEGDLVLEYFRDGEFMEPAERSDQDLQDVLGNEAIMLSVTVGQTLYFKVSALTGGMGEAIPYRLLAGLMRDW